MLSERARIELWEVRVPAAVARPITCCGSSCAATLGREVARDHNVLLVSDELAELGLGDHEKRRSTRPCTSWRSLSLSRTIGCAGVRPLRLPLEHAPLESALGRQAVVANVALRTADQVGVLEHQQLGLEDLGLDLSEPFPRRQLKTPDLFTYDGARFTEAVDLVLDR
jgi:hypothetical protein